eukprot:scaffold680310_cov74-Prasinocladus_malaysianus.AAC.1
MRTVRPKLLLLSSTRLRILPGTSRRSLEHCVALAETACPAFSYHHCELRSAGRYLVARAFTSAAADDV